MSILKPRLAVCLDDLRMEVKAAMDVARRIGFRAIDVSAVRGPISPGELSATGRRHLLRHLADLGLSLGGLRGPTGAGSLADPQSAERRIDETSRILELAAALKVPTVSLTCGRFGVSGEGGIDRLREAFSVLADRADRWGVTLAIETSGVPTAQLGEILRGLDCPSLKACCDSGAMLMQGEEPSTILANLRGRLALARLRDARSGTAEHAGQEVRLGEGQLDVPHFLAALDEAGLSGDIILTRAESARPADELRSAREAIERFL
ncbi:MAG TPA: sugar phosphate isomerase/epimerase family protein [Phycisphaerae bacterium]|nr:sugar phosphate isomerase/epimerase family protein [Phycisphaerae bacterium]